MLLHIGGASAASVAAVVTVIFLLIFAMSFAFGSVPEGERKFSGPWLLAWLKASAPRLMIAAVFSVAVFVGSAVSGGGSSNSPSNCDNVLPPLSGGTITDARLVVAIGSLNDMTAAADSGDEERVRTLFYTTDAHNLTHDIDRPLRASDEAAAKNLCAHVIALENQIGGPLEVSSVSQYARDIAADLQNARAILAANTTATPVLTGSVADPCAQPVGAITTEQLTAQRLETSIDQMRQAAQLAAAGDAAGAQAIFNEPHNLSHDIDGPLREADNDLAVQLCRSIVAIELHLGARYDAQVMQTESAKSADLFQQAGEALSILP